MYDGDTGHAITLLGLDPATSSIVYYDPWPGQSLLSAGNTLANVSDVQCLTRKGQRLWMVKPAELQEIYFAVVVLMNTREELLLVM
jgi:hypothetical protein